MKITIIGGSGFIGSELKKILNSSGYRYTNIDKNPAPANDGEFIQADIRDQFAIDAAVNPADWVVLLAAEHRDDVTPTSLYYDVNVEGTKKVLEAMDKKGIKKIIFTSTVAIYGLNKKDPDEGHPADPFNHYGKSKWQAEEVLRAWHSKAPTERTLIIIRPTVVFGAGNRGNVYNLLKQIASGRFLMIGPGNNKKSMAYVENVTCFLKYCMDSDISGYNVYNYADKPDLSTQELVKQAGVSMGKKVAPVKIPYTLGYAGGLMLDLAARIFNRKFPISAVRIKKFCATTQFSAKKVHSSGFVAPFTLQEGLNKTMKSILTNETAY